MLFYTNTIHDFDMARWLMQDEVAEVHCYGTSATRPELADYGDVVASVINLRFCKGGIGNIDSHAQALYAYDVRTEIVGSKGSMFIGSIEGAPATFLSSAGASAVLADHFLSRFADAYLNEVRAFVATVLGGKAPQVNGEDGFRALEIAVAAEKSHRNGQPCKITQQAAEKGHAFGGQK